MGEFLEDQGCLSCPSRKIPSTLHKVVSAFGISDRLEVNIFIWASMHKFQMKLDENLKIRVLSIE